MKIFIYQSGSIEYLNENIKYFDGIIVSDFGYGLITSNILDHLSKLSKTHNIKLFGDSQSSSQIGNVLKFNDYFFFILRTGKINR